MNAARYLILAATAIAIAVAASSVSAAGERPRSTRRRRRPPGPTPSRLEPVRGERDRHDGGTAAACRRSELRNGAGSGLRRRQRDRRDARAIPRRPSCKPVRLEGGRGGDGGFHRARGHVPGAAADAAATLRRIPRSDPGRRPEGERYSRRRGGRGGDAGRAPERRTLRHRADVPAPAPGIWRPTPPFNAPDPVPWLANVRPFLVPNVEMLRSDGPNPLTSDAYAKDFNEVKELGSLTSTTRTPEQTAIAIFWQGSSWNSALRGLSTSQGLDTAARARLFAMAYLAAADGYIGCWNDKYHWTFWRPITAIREADTDGNPATEADPTGRRCSTRPRRSSRRPRSRPRRSPTTPLLTRARAAPSSTRSGTSSAPTRSPSPSPAANPRRPGLRPLLRRAQGGHRRARLGRHPLPHRRRPRGGARQEGRPLAQEALLPADS